MRSRNLVVILLIAFSGPLFADDTPWPPLLSGATNGTVTLTSEQFLKVPDSVVAASEKEGAAPFVMAKTPPTVELSFHRDLGPGAIGRRLWSSWGDICLARDGRVYCGIGDHGNDVGGDARCFLYCWDPKRKTLTQVVDVNAIVTREPGQPAWSKMHAKVDEGLDGTIYFCGTLNDGNRAKLPTYHWSDTLPGAQLYQYDPKTGKASVFANLPPKRCTATSLLDTQRNIWWCNLEAGEGNALWGLNLTTKQPVFQGTDGSLGFNRNFALLADGSILFNGASSLGLYEAGTKQLVPKKSSFPNSHGMRASTLESKDGFVFGITHQTNQLFRYHVVRDELELLGPNWLAGMYTAVTVLSPDERFVYYQPGAHGQAFKDGTPVMQYEIATGRRKVLAFLASVCEQECGYVPGGTYGLKLSADGSTIFVNLNGHAADSVRPASMKTKGFGLCAFAAIHIPESERAGH
ncbi:MAG: hypothetical protein ACKV2Q_03405 [Planctomycetaceae bacterium]